MRISESIHSVSDKISPNDKKHIVKSKSFKKITQFRVIEAPEALKSA